MKSLDNNKIRYAVEQLNVIPEGKEYPKLFFPLEWLVLCGWDKIAYDEDLIKYTAGTLYGEELQVFETIYVNILNILARIEQLCGLGKINYNFYKVLIEQFGGSGLVSSKQQKTIQDRVNKFKKQQKLENTSGLEIK